MEFGNYRFLYQDQIGEGSFGKVYRGKNILTGATVAVKVIPKAMKSNDELLCLKEECNILRTLKHPNIIEFLESFETRFELVLVTECAKGSLVQLVGKNGRMLLERIQIVACNLVSALYYLHSNRIFHRDIKPQNVLIGADGLFKLCDFGFARKVDLGTYVLTSLKGTPLYMAPEVLDDQPYDQSADLWSLGCILYELIVGRVPFYTNSYKDLAIMMKTAPVEWPSNISTECLSFLQGLLEKDPGKRLIWPNLLRHPFVSKGVHVVPTYGPFPLTKVLSPSQELVKEKQMRRVLENKLSNYAKAIERNNRKLEETQKKLIQFQKYNAVLVHSPMSNCNTNLAEVGDKNANVATPVIQAETANDSVLKKIPIVGETKKNDCNSSSSSCETMTSTSSDDLESENEDVRTIIMGASPKCNGTQCKLPETLNLNKLQITDNKFESRANDKNQTRIISENNLVKSGALFTLHSFGSEDKPIENEEWAQFLTKTMKEVIQTPSTLCEKHYLTMLVAPLRNHLTSTPVVEKIAILLSLPFTMPGQNGSNFIKNLETFYLDTKVVPNLLYACKLIVRRRIVGNDSLDLQDIASSLSVEDLEGLYKSIRLICFLVHSEEDFVIQFCDSVCVLQILSILKLFLKLDKRKSSLTSNTVAILCHVIRTTPSNVAILEELFLEDTAGHSEIWRLLNHSNAEIQSRVLRILAYLILFSAKSVEQLVQTKCSRLWNLLKNCSSHKELDVRTASKFVMENLRFSPFTKNKIEVLNFVKSPVP